MCQPLQEPLGAGDLLRRAGPGEQFVDQLVRQIPKIKLGGADWHRRLRVALGHGLVSFPSRSRPSGPEAAAPAQLRPHLHQETGQTRRASAGWQPRPPPDRRGSSSSMTSVGPAAGSVGAMSFPRLRGTLPGLAHALSLGAVSWVFSEGVFWASWRDDEGLGGVALTWLAYSVVSYLALAAARRFAVGTWAGWFVVGALFGWLAEGALAGTVLVTAPQQISWTGLAWHAPLTVCVGWVALPAALRGSLVRAIAASAAVGAGFGLWAAGYVHEPDGDGVPTLGAFAVYATALAALLGLAYALCDRLGRSLPERPGRVPVALAGLALAGWYGLGVAPTSPLSVPLVLVLIAAPLLLLRRAPLAAPAPRPSAPRLRGSSLGALLALPAMAVATFAAFEPFAGELPVYAAFLLLTPGGVVALAWSARRVRRLGP